MHGLLRNLINLIAEVLLATSQPLMLTLTVNQPKDSFTLNVWFGVCDVRRTDQLNTGAQCK